MSGAVEVSLTTPVSLLPVDGKEKNDEDLELGYLPLASLLAVSPCTSRH
jgi:hypothetical protein